MNAEDYGFRRVDNVLLPEIVISKPEGLPDPCTCGKCAQLASSVVSTANAREVIAAKIQLLNELFKA